MRGFPLEPAPFGLAKSLGCGRWGCSWAQRWGCLIRAVSSASAVTLPWRTRCCSLAPHRIWSVWSGPLFISLSCMAKNRPSWLYYFNFLKISLKGQHCGSISCIYSDGSGFCSSCPINCCVVIQTVHPSQPRLLAPCRSRLHVLLQLAVTNLCIFFPSNTGYSHHCANLCRENTVLIEKFADFLWHNL